MIKPVSDAVLIAPDLDERSGDSAGRSFVQAQLAPTYDNLSGDYFTRAKAADIDAVEIIISGQLAQREQADNIVRG